MESALVPVGNGSPIFVLPKAREMLEKAGTVQDIRKVESFADLARKYAKAAKMGREAVNAAARINLDARRKMGATLVAMQASGELASRGMCPSGTSTLVALNLTRKQSSQYRLEATVPLDDYERWARRVIESEDGLLTPTGLRRLARNLAKSDANRPTRPDSILAKRQIRRYVAKLARTMGPHAARCLPGILIALSNEFAVVENCYRTPVAAKTSPAAKRRSARAWCYEI